MYLNKKALGLVALIIFCFAPTVSSAESVPFEQTASRRQSIRDYTSQNITNQELLGVLHAAYGFWSGHRSVSRIGYDNCLIIFPVNATGCYRYSPEENLLLMYYPAVNKETLRPHVLQSYPTTASVVNIIVWNKTKMDNGYFALAEAGMLVQNLYLAANSLNLGTSCVTGIKSEDMRSAIGFPNTMIPLLIMPLGYPPSSYPAASPNYDMMTGNLPPVQYSSLNFTTTLSNMFFTQAWSNQSLSLQELSQLLWAAYGYSNVSAGGSYHRTTPSAYGIYPLVVYLSNATAIYQYIPETHSVTKIQSGDKRLEIANACGGQTWASNAPAIFIPSYNSSYNGGNTGDDTMPALPHEHIEVDAGCVVQQLFLEASAWNLRANIVSSGFEEWNGTAAEGLRNTLGLAPSLIPLYAMPIGHRRPHPPLVGDVNGDDKVDGKDIAIVAKYFGSIGGFPPYADVNLDGKVDGKDIAIVAKHFGEKYP